MASFGYFADPETGRRLSFQESDIRHLEGRRLKGIWGHLFPWVEIPRVKVLHEILFIDRNKEEWRVPAEFISDGASVPWWLWWICDPFQSRVLAPALVHDVICDCRGPQPFWEADNIFFDAMRCQRYYLFGACINWFFVMVFGPKFTGEKESR